MVQMTTGVIGLDEMLSGGIPSGHIVAILGSPGTGKSTISLQFIYAGLLKGENCIYLSLEENEENIIKTDIKPFVISKNGIVVHSEAEIFS
jgi:KaiC/GvpD/RAD55 family RecA-like ATPase